MKRENKISLAAAEWPRSAGAAVRTCALLAAALTAAACSTTRRLAEGQTLYTGVTHMKVESVTEGEKVPGSVQGAVKAPLGVKPNNALVSPWVRTPLPIGLWAYNSLYTEKTRGVRAWLYRTLSAQPVVVERDVQPDARVGMVRDILDNHGYFGSGASYEIFPRRNPRKARVGYAVTVAPPWLFATVRFPEPRDSLTRTIAAIAASSNLRPGLQYNVDTLARERERIASALRERGYYHFRPEYLEYTADTTRVPRGVDLRMDISPAAPPAALAPYRIGKLSLSIASHDAWGGMDSLETEGIGVRYQNVLLLRPSVIRRAMRPVASGDVMAQSRVNLAMDNLARLGVFRYANLETTPLEKLLPGDSIDLNVQAAMTIPMEITAEADLSYKSSNFLGPRLGITASHGNLFYGGETLSLSFTGSYEWQTGKIAELGGSRLNSYELGIKTSLMFPRLLVPRFIGLKLNRRPGGKTSYSLAADLANRPRFFQMLTFNVSNTYDFRTSGTVSHSLTLFRLAYNNLLRTTAEFDAEMERNTMIRLSFADQFIPSGSYTFTFDKRFGPLRRHRATVQVGLTTAGNLWAGGYSLFGAGRGAGAKRFFGQPFSQFFKETIEGRLYKKIGERGTTLALRLFAGAGHAYGNSVVLPYTEQFYVGGANSVRAFTVRSIGPGSYRYLDGGNAAYRYFDQTGELKMEANAELRFPLTGGLNGALFLDAGNIWLLRDDPDRPGGRIGSDGFWSSVATGTGAGVRYDLSFLVLRLDVGVGIHLPYATARRGYYNIDRFRDGLGIHIAVGYPF